MRGNLYLIPSFLGTDVYADVFPELNREIIRQIKIFIVEDERNARRFLKKIIPDMVIDELTFHLLNEHTKPDSIGHYLHAGAGEHVGLMSDAGVPCVADPGARVVMMAHKSNMRVVPFVGPSSIMLALMASGLNGQSFAFSGYLPVQKPERIKALKMLEKRSVTENQTQLFIETPYRNNQMLDDILNVCEPETYLTIAADITLPSQLIVTQSIKEWKTKKPDIHKRPAIFILQKGMY